MFSSVFLCSALAIADYKIIFSPSVLNEKALFGNVSPPVPSTPLLTETGENGNIALIGTNGLTASSYEISSFWQSYHKASNLFDGFSDNLKVNSDATVNSGFRWNSASQENENQWIKVDFGKEVTISGFRVFATQSFISYLPKDVMIQYSTDGSNYETHESLIVPMATNSGVLSLSGNLSTRYLRFFMVNNHGATAHIVLNELEIFQQLLFKNSINFILNLTL
jgi:hypothetical protein